MLKLEAWARTFRLRKLFWLELQRIADAAAEAAMATVLNDPSATDESLSGDKDEDIRDDDGATLRKALERSKSTKAKIGCIADYSGITGAAGSIERGAARLLKLGGAQNVLPPAMRRVYRDLIGSSLRIFLSSTFRDMNGEREIFIKRYSSALRQVAKERGVSVTFVDLRWGVTVAQASSGEVVDICLTQLQRSRYFVSFLGLRYHDDALTFPSSTFRALAS